MLTKPTCVSIIVLFCFILTSACSQDSTAAPNDQTAEQAIKKLEELEPVTHAYAVHYKNKLYAAAEVKQLDRFRLKPISKDAEELLKKEWKNEKIAFSTDQKVILEINELNEDLQNKSLGEKKINKRLKKIKRFTKKM
ncbi:YhcN/YlaJ family sporulation lipoprotein [Alteribacillus sp. HJP-4]|uniref:YhcN/YlaJ family sporulation lipoprotein n=1 Tax=Alteribacillus sp. HJP-4 TaxID=2775394 RepID=UPI0035CD034B